VNNSSYRDKKVVGVFDFSLPFLDIDLPSVVQLMNFSQNSTRLHALIPTSSLFPGQTPVEGPAKGFLPADVSFKNKILPTPTPLVTPLHLLRVADANAYNHKVIETVLEKTAEDDDAEPPRVSSPDTPALYGRYLTCWRLRSWF
jgi:hypothetical protein